LFINNWLILFSPSAVESLVGAGVALVRPQSIGASAN